MRVRSGILKRLHVRQDRLRANVKDGGDREVLVVQSVDGPSYGNEAVLVCACGSEVARLVYRSKPLSCGARAYVETRAEVVLRPHASD